MSRSPSWAIAAYSRTVRSLAYLPGPLPGRARFISSRYQSSACARTSATTSTATASFYTETAEWDDLVPKVDILYMTRPQKEWFTDETLFNQVKDRFVLDLGTARRMRPDARILHPLPRNDEIALAVDALPQAAYFRQSDYGPPLRTALFQMVCG